MKNLSDNPAGQQRNGETQTGQSRANPYDIGWLAGIIDGEGHLRANCRTGQYKNTIQPNLIVSTTSIVMMESMQRIVFEVTGRVFPLTLESQRKTKDGRRYHRRCYRLNITKHRDLLTVLTAVEPHLRTKKQQAIELIAFCKARLAKKSYNEPYTAEQHKLPELLQVLGRKS